MIEAQEIRGQNYVLYDRYQFDLARKGITLITGANRAGKSLLPSSIPLVLYGSPPVASERQKVKMKEVLMRKNAVSGFVWKNNKTKWSLDVETKGQSQHYRVHRNGKDLELHRKGDAMDKVNAAFPISEDLFFTCYYLSASQPHVLHSGTPAQRMAFVEGMFDLGVFDEMRKDFSDKLNKLRGQIAGLAEYEERLQELGESQDLEALRKQLKVTDLKIRKRQETAHKQRDRISRLDKFIELSKAKIEGNHTELTAQIVSLRAKYEKLKLHIREVEAIEDNNIRAKENAKHREELEKKIEGFNFDDKPERTDKLEEALRIMRNEYEDAVRDHNRLAKLVKEVRQSGPLSKIYTAKELLQDKDGKLLDKLTKRFAVHDLIVNLPAKEQDLPEPQSS
jgi:DNA repair exonuclease SbcCD ATPase subunit